MLTLNTSCCITFIDLDTKIEKKLCLTNCKNFILVLFRCNKETCYTKIKYDQYERFDKWYNIN